MREVPGAQAQVWERKGGLRDTEAEEAHPTELSRSTPSRSEPPADPSPHPTQASAPPHQVAHTFGTPFLAIKDIANNELRLALGLGPALPWP